MFVGDFLRLCDKDGNPIKYGVIVPPDKNLGWYGANYTWVLWEDGEVSSLSSWANYEILKSPKWDLLEESRRQKLKILSEKT